jgi:hypothetical protein
LASVSLRRALSEYVDHYHEERNHQGKGNCYFLGTGTSIVSGASNAASDWTGSCVIIIKRPRNLAEQSRIILWLEVDCCAGNDYAAGKRQVSPNIACAVDRQSHERLGNNQRASIP